MTHLKSMGPLLAPSPPHLLRLWLTVSSLLLAKGHQPRTRFCWNMEIMFSSLDTSTLQNRPQHSFKRIKTMCLFSWYLDRKCVKLKCEYSIYSQCLLHEFKKFKSNVCKNFFPPNSAFSPGMRAKVPRRCLAGRMGQPQTQGSLPRAETAAHPCLPSGHSCWWAGLCLVWKPCCLLS